MRILTIALFYSNVRVRGDSETACKYQHPNTAAATWNSATIHSPYTGAFLCCVITGFLLWKAGVSRVSPEVHPSETNSWECSFCPHTAFPLIFIKHFQRSWPLDKEGPETVPEADLDFEEITAAEIQTVCYVGFILDLTDTHHICKCTCRTQGVSRFVILSVFI